MNRQYTREPAATSGHADPAAGLDPALLEALRDHNPLAVRAMAGVLDNSFLLSLMNGTPPVGAREVEDRVSALQRPEDREIARGIGWAGGDLDRREGPDEGSDGSGVHGRLDPTTIDLANHAFWQTVVVTAEGMGLVNAARHLQHYLDNSGSPLDLNLNLLLRDVPDPVQAELAWHKDRLTEGALVALDDTDTTLGGAWDDATPKSSLEEHYIHKDHSEDWFFGMGGHTSWLEGSCAYVPDADGSGRGTLVFDVSWNLTDVYNWDGDKSVDIKGIIVSDAVLGRLHATGLAREFPMSGRLPVSFAVRYLGQSEVPDIPGVKLPGDERDGTRADPDRDRR